MSDKSYVSLGQHRCLVCGQDFDSGEILLDKRLRKSLELKTVMGMGLCPKHQKLYDDGYVALVGIDPDKSTPVDNRLDFNDAHRTGRIAHLRFSAWDNVFNTPFNMDEDNKPLSFVFIEDAIITKLSGEEA